MNKRARGVVQGIVQGVGFRPFIFQLAKRFNLFGFVTNTPRGVDLEVEGEEENLLAFFNAITQEHPPLAHISSLDWFEIPPKGDTEFTILKSRRGEERFTLISPDVCICEDCLAELMDPNDRRFRYPFINCTNCGPRYTIIKDIPYDRATTTMSKFKMCKSCSDEYHDPTNRRFHAQPNACWECGPRTYLHDSKGKQVLCDDPVLKAVELLQEGHILAIKGLGGFHLAVDATNHRAVVRLRRRKHREEKPLAVMVSDLESARKIAHINDKEAEILTSRQRPILLLRKRRFHGLSPQVAPKNNYFGIMLPYTPLHYLIMEGNFPALVMTSGNMTEEPINIHNDDAFKNLKDIADFFLVHDRDIYLRSDDSVVKLIHGVPRQIRRSRGYVPVPIFMPKEMEDIPPALGVGGELKNTICLTKGANAFMSQHVGDMENLETFHFFELTVSHLKKILEVEPHVIGYDLHPDYLTTKYTKNQAKLPSVGIQHHHAHIVSCMAEHGLTREVIGIAMDGTGLGTDGQIWGGEFFLADLCSFTRIAHLNYIPLPGGDMAARHPWRMGLIYLYRAYGQDLFGLPIPFVRKLNKKQADLIISMSEKGLNSPMTSSCGRLFDAVSAILGIRTSIAYEGQAAIELEMCQTRNVPGTYSFSVQHHGDVWTLDPIDTIKEIVSDIIEGESRGKISARFHNTLIEMFARVATEISENTGLKDVVLSGGAFQNATLLSGLTLALKKGGLNVYSHRLVPTNDGGLALGQAICAAMVFSGKKGRFKEI